MVILLEQALLQILFLDVLGSIQAQCLSDHVYYRIPQIYNIGLDNINS